MNDQATRLRELVIEDALQRSERPESSATRICFCSGRAGVGTTTAALNAAMALARGGARTVLVSRKNDAACFPEELFDPLERSPGELGGLLSAGPFGLNWLKLTDDHFPAEQLAQIAEFIVVDAGVSADADFVESADVVVYVTTQDNASILDTYALMKSQPADATGFVIANRVTSDEAAWSLIRRFCETSAQHLGRALKPAAVIPADDQRRGTHAGDHDCPLLLHTPNGEFARRFQVLAEDLQRASSPRASGSPEAP